MLARTKQTPTPPTLDDRIHAMAEKVRAVDAEIKDVIELWLDEQKQTNSGSGLPRETIRQMLMGKYGQPWFCILGLDAERPQ